MAVQAQEEVRQVADFTAPEGFLVTSICLNIDAEAFPSPEQVLSNVNSVLHEAESKRKEIEETLSHDSAESLRGDLERFRELFGDGRFDREDTRGIAFFSCSAEGYEEVVRTTTPLENSVEFGSEAYAAPLAAFLSHSKPTAILLTDRKQARIITMAHGEVREWTDFRDDAPSYQKQGGWSQARYQRRVENFAKHHVDKGTELLLKLLQHYPFDWLILGTEVQVQHETEESLHPYVKDRLIGHISVRIDAPLEEVVERARELREEVEQSHIQRLIEQITEYAGAGGRATIGLKETLQALNEQKVHILLVEQGFAAPGSICSNCGMLMAEERSTCAACNEPATHVDDIVGAAVQKALRLGSVVEVALEPGQLDAVQQIGAVLYY
jgi:peptide subunit release factor 1 (eRF1)